MRNHLPLKHHKALASEITPLYRWDGKAPIGEWREKCREKLLELLGMDAFKPCEPNFEITSEDELNGNRHIHFILQTEEGYYTHCDLLLPKEHTKKLPICVCLQGHSKGSHISLGQVKYPGDENCISEGDRDFAVRAVKEGFAALAIEQRAFGACGGTEGGPQCLRPAVTALLLGRTIIGERIWDVMRALDAIETHFSHIITFENSVLVGNSGGGTTTYYTACLEDRLAGFMPSCAVCTYRDSIVNIDHCICNYVPGIAEYFDMGDLAVMIAPKKLVLVCGEQDDIFPLHGVKETFGIIENLYKAADAEDCCALVVGAGGHRFYADDAWPLMHRLLEK